LISHDGLWIRFREKREKKKEVKNLAMLCQIEMGILASPFNSTFSTGASERGMSRPGSVGAWRKKGHHGGGMDGAGGFSLELRNCLIETAAEGDGE
jgi:hypothetical protein